MGGSTRKEGFCGQLGVKAFSLGRNLEIGGIPLKGWLIPGFLG